MFNFFLKLTETSQQLVRETFVGLLKALFWIAGTLAFLLMCFVPLAGLITVPFFATSALWFLSASFIWLFLSIKVLFAVVRTIEARDRKMGSGFAAAHDEAFSAADSLLHSGDQIYEPRGRNKSMIPGTSEFLKKFGSDDL